MDWGFPEKSNTKAPKGNEIPLEPFFFILTDQLTNGRGRKEGLNKERYVRGTRPLAVQIPPSDPFFRRAEGKVRE